MERPNEALGGNRTVVLRQVELHSFLLFLAVWGVERPNEALLVSHRGPVNFDMNILKVVTVSSEKPQLRAHSRCEHKPIGDAGAALVSRSPVAPHHGCLKSHVNSYNPSDGLYCERRAVYREKRGLYSKHREAT